MRFHRDGYGTTGQGFLIQGGFALIFFFFFFIRLFSHSDDAPGKRPNLVRNRKSSHTGCSRQASAPGHPFCNLADFRTLTLKVKICAWPTQGQRKSSRTQPQLHGQQVGNWPGPLKLRVSLSSSCGSAFQQEGRDLGTRDRRRVGSEQQGLGWRKLEYFLLPVASHFSKPVQSRCT